MHPDLLDILCCPEDKAPLRLHATDRDGDEVRAGSLTCTQCGFAYPIEEGIPNLLPQDWHADEVRDADP